MPSPRHENAPFLVALTLIATLCLSLPAAAQENTPSLDVMIGQMLLAGFRGTTLEASPTLRRDMTIHHLGGVVLFNHDVVLGHGPRNIENPAQVKSLVDELQQLAKRSRSGLPLFVSIDQEGGKVQRLRKRSGFTETDSPATLARNPDDPLPAKAAGERTGTQLHRLGINLDFAPVLDLNVNPANPVIGRLGRSFGNTPEQVVRLAGAFTDGLRDQGVLSCVKHFPGHGSSRSDSHLGVTDVTATWTATELVPFRSFLQADRTDMVMTAHLFNANWDPDHPATLSKKVVTGILREQWGYDGVVITDDMNMKAITDQYGLEKAIFLAIDAGCDILLLGNNLSHDPDIVPKASSIIATLVADGRLTKERIRQSYRRIAALKKRLSQLR